jgi:hypothetical protein
MNASMLGTEPIAATAAVSAAGSDQIRLDHPAPRGTVLIARLVLGLLLAAASVLIPGEAPRLLETPLTWADLGPQPTPAPTVASIA